MKFAFDECEFFLALSHPYFRISRLDINVIGQGEGQMSRKLCPVHSLTF